MIAKILVDNCIFSLGIITEKATQTKKINWGGNLFDVEITGFRGKEIPSGQDEWKRMQLLALPTIARLAREHKVRLFAYEEIDFEGLKRSGGRPALFHGVIFENVMPAVGRSHFQHSDFFHHVEAERVIKFVRFLLCLDINKVSGICETIKTLSDFDVANLKQLSRLCELCRDLDDEKTP